jgi:hypothetical protein
MTADLATTSCVLTASIAQNSERSRKFILRHLDFRTHGFEGAASFR